jgi:hypothetical protein
VRSALPRSLPLALALLACSPEDIAGLSAGGPASRATPIIHGEACDASYEADTAVAILVDATISFGGSSVDLRTVVCTGTLIAEDTVLTAAHCLDASALTLGFGEVQSERYFVTFEHDLMTLAQQETEDFPADAVEAAAFIAHEGFELSSLNAETVNGPGEFHDIGLLFLSERITAVRPAVVLTPDEAGAIAVDNEVTIAGWGQQVQTSGPFEAPPAGSVGMKICATSFVNEVGPWEFQVGGDDTTSRKCHGDSGGPSYAVLETSHTRKQRVVGVTSHAYDAEDCNKGGIDTRVDAYYGWLDDSMKAACADGTRAWCDVPGVVPPSYYDPPGAGDKDDDDDDDDDDDGVPPVQPPAFCECVRAGDAELGPPSWALLFFGGLALLLRRRR